MDKDIVLVLIGGGIGMVSSLLPMAYNWKLTNKIRNQELQDRDKENYNQIIKGRLQQIEDFTINSYKWTQTVTLEIAEMNELTNDGTNFLKLSKPLFNHVTLSVIANTLNNENLKKFVDEYSAQLRSALAEVIKATNPEIPPETRMKSLGNLLELVQTIDPYVENIITAIDQMNVTLTQ